MRSNAQFPEGFSVLIWTPYKLPRFLYTVRFLKQNEVNTHIISISLNRILWQLVQFVHLIKNANVLLTYTPAFFSIIPIVIGKAFRKTVLFEMGYSCAEAAIYEHERKWKIRLWRITEWLACKMADLVFVDTMASRKYFSRIYGIPESKIIALYSLVDHNHFRPMEKNSKLLEKYQLRDKFVIMYHGSFLRLHGLEYVIEAFNRALGKNPNLELVLIGKGDKQLDYKILAQEFNLLKENKVIFMGWVPYHLLPKFLSMADIYVGAFSSQEKAQRALRAGIVEAMAMGKPVITARTKEASNFLTDGENVLFTKPEDSEDISNKIITLFRKPDLAASLGKEARILVIEKMSLKEFNRKLVEAFKTAIHKKESVVASVPVYKPDD